MAEDPAAPVLRTTPGNSNLKKIGEITQEFKERDIRQKAKLLGIKYIDLQKAPLNQDALQLVTWEQVEKTQSVPFEIVGKQLKVACVDPFGPDCKQMLALFTEKGFQVEQYICSPEGIASVKHHYDSFGTQQEVQLDTHIEEGGSAADMSSMFAGKEQIFEKGTGPEMVNEVNLHAIKFKASDIHYQPQEQDVAIRMRRDGQLYETLRLSHKQFQLLSGEIKRSAGLKSNVRNVPQDGDYEFIANERKISVRVSTLPSKFGESIVLRILDAQKAVVELDKLGFSEKNKAVLERKLQKDRGLILVTGPTGSGKTSTLYSGLNKLNQPNKKIITLEDPVEFQLPNIIQSQIEEEVDFTFASGLRAILRQDPDVIMVGEIRDKSAAEIALQASLTGHLVLSTLHSNDAIGAIPRLLNIGVEPYILAPGLELVMAQRLVRRMCSSCKAPQEVNESMKKEINDVVANLQKKGMQIDSAQVYAAKGCETCANTGFDGRLSIAEVLPISEAIRKAILDGESSQKILEIAEAEGYITMKEDGVLKVLAGETTLEEIWGVLV